MFYRITNGSITLGSKTILEDINFTIKNDEKIGIVGRNGTGKTTLLKAIIGELELSDGYDILKIEKTPHIKIGYVKQNETIDKELTMLEYIKLAFKEIIEVEKELSLLEDKLSNSYTEEVLNKYNDLLEKYTYLGKNSYIKEYESMLKKFNFTEQDKSKKIKDFSGGEMTKLSLIKLLLESPDLLILDEPTNHLDINTTIWLEEYLKNYKKSIVVVSHDRMFLDNVCNVIYDIEYGSLKRYNGNYTYFVKKKEEDYEKALKDYEEQQKEIKRLQTIADKFRYKPTKASMAMSKLKQIERMIKLEKPESESTKTFKFNIDKEKDSYKDVLKVKSLTVGYDKPLKTLSFDLYKKDKLGIIGENGIGKSTLLKTLIGEIPPLTGKYVFGPNTEIGYFSQKLENLDNNNTIYDEIDYAFPKLSPNEIRTMLGTFEFTGDDVFKKINDLSGGEKVKVSLCKIINKKPNILIMDEPTNHLDIISKNTIEKMLKNYQGTIILVSHDRYLIKNVCNKLIEFTKEDVIYYNYGYEEYLKKKENPIREELINSVKKINIKEVNKNNKDTNISKKIKLIEKEIDTLSLKLNNLNDELSKENIYMDYNKSNEIKKEIDNINTKIESLTEEWDTLVNDIY